MAQHQYCKPHTVNSTGSALEELTRVLDDDHQFHAFVLPKMLNK